MWQLLQERRRKNVGSHSRSNKAGGIGFAVAPHGIAQQGCAGMLPALRFARNAVE
jgi:hypothetical protein